ncbi:hypothetical protein SAMN05660242_1245 [Thermoanaerobacterium sp. RBIITD]|nr:DUF6557 family protein [Thermoanaerobacterium sp. RBIITD]SNX53678.1 hypothetical protein SAMN05660242_1245 [Thermoanaerobacterium sp. RBIITD]
MNIKELFFKTLWQDVEKALIKLYPDQKENIKTYKKVYKNVKCCKPTTNSEKTTICIDLVSQDKETCYDVYGIEKD